MFASFYYYYFTVTAAGNSPHSVTVQQQGEDKVQQEASTDLNMEMDSLHCIKSKSHKHNAEKQTGV